MLELAGQSWLKASQAERSEQAERSTAWQYENHRSGLKTPDAGNQKWQDDSYVLGGRNCIQALLNTSRMSLTQTPVKANLHQSKLQRLVRKIATEPQEIRIPFVRSIISEAMQTKYGIQNLKSNFADHR